MTTKNLFTYLSQLLNHKDKFSSTQAKTFHHTKYFWLVKCFAGKKSDVVVKDPAHRIGNAVGTVCKSAVGRVCKTRKLKHGSSILGRVSIKVFCKTKVITILSLSEDF